MKVILYKTKHGSTLDVANMISENLGDCTLMELKSADKATLESADSIIIGVPVYFGKLEQDMVKFINDNKDLFTSKNCSMYVTGVMPADFMKFVNQSLDSSIINHMKVLSGVGGMLRFKELTISDKMILQVMNQHFSIMSNQDTNVFDNLDKNEIQSFCEKVKNIA